MTLMPERICRVFFLSPHAKAAKADSLEKQKEGDKFRNVTKSLVMYKKTQLMIVFSL